MKVLATSKLKKKIAVIDATVQNALSAFIRMVKDLNENRLAELVETDDLMEGNIYVRRLQGMRLFYAIENDERGHIVVLLLDLIKGGLTPAKITNRNPRMNVTINPYVNGSINPHINSAINPSINPSINPVINSSINPTANPSINPAMNPSINPTMNPSINPVMNSSINPNINSSINPNINPAFKGYYVYDLDLNPTEFAIRANDKVLMFFDFDGTNTRFAVAHSSRGYVVFDAKNNEWVAHLESDGSAGFNLFSLSNEWIAILK